jgi:hypothetical protein
MPFVGDAVKVSIKAKATLPLIMPAKQQILSSYLVNFHTFGP